MPFFRSALLHTWKVDSSLKDTPPPVSSAIEEIAQPPVRTLGTFPGCPLHRFSVSPCFSGALFVLFSAWPIEIRPLRLNSEDVCHNLVTSDLTDAATGPPPAPNLQVDPDPHDSLFPILGN